MKLLKFRLDFKNNRQILYVIGFLLLLIVFNFVYKNIKTKQDENFLVITEVQDLATNNIQAILNSTNQVKFANSNVGNYFTGASGGNTLTDILSDIYKKVDSNTKSIATMNTSISDLVASNVNISTMATNALSTANSAQTTATTANTNALTAMGGMVPVGTIIAWNKPDLPDATWKYCDGSSTNIVYTNNAGRLVSIDIPDLSGRFVLAKGTSTDPNNSNVYETGNIGGAEKHSLSLDEMPGHTHTYGIATGISFLPYANAIWGISNKSLQNTSANVSAVAAADGLAGYYPLTSPMGGNKTADANVLLNDPNFDSTLSKSGTGKLYPANPHNNMPPYYTLSYIIKVYETVSQASQ